ncbi:2,3-dihydroxyphenylpropionate 1,2-dioxygenase [Raineyella antarctica]|uniref:2,3-dihydroxyphenylpropionate/2,3-dihydroxicinnamic acid 1,2-dioxygenase n=1 Tax=Raineyella antarctica TaxID=1577474 RepID=A0A1G6GF39_9ACTN|nr:3-carboxyethylcatechol 2,3-dioxygenase [Raineyella antarctica]SDB80580.1 2,3-dihydroxyphenylpropionate 1,2-dioxygenase [Raineyella antarctica]
MSLALVAMSHSPLLHTAELPPSDAVRARVDAAFAAIHDFARAYDPTLVVVFAPDHYNGVFYDMLPPFAVGLAATGIGDYGSTAGPLSVDEDHALAIVRHAQQADVDMTLSRRLEVDHGAVQPLETLFGGIDARPVVPVFVNGVAAPFVPMRRIRAMGQAVGDYLASLDERVLVIASGGLSHDPPVPQWDTAPEAVRAGLIDGRHPSAEAREARQRRVIEGAAAFARGEAAIRDLNPGWDRTFMADCASGDVARFDAYEADAMTEEAGHSSHEVRTWVAAFSALAAAGPYETTYEYYEPIPEYIAGFGVMAARTR